MSEVLCKRFAAVPCRRARFTQRGSGRSRWCARVQDCGSASGGAFRGGRAACPSLTPSRQPSKPQFVSQQDGWRLGRETGPPGARRIRAAGFSRRNSIQTIPDPKRVTFRRNIAGVSFLALGGLRGDELSTGTTMVTKDNAIQFCRTCVEWAEQATNPSDRQIIVNVARSWLETVRLVDNQILADHEARLN